MIAHILQLAAAGYVGWRLRGSWTSAADTAAQARIASLRAELDDARQTAATVRDVYLTGLARCTCNPEPQGFTDLHYDPKLIGDA